MSETTQAVSPAVVEAKSRRTRAQMGDVVELTTGVRVRLSNVPPGLLEDVVSHIQDPPVPTWFNEDKGREEPNPADPDYQKALATAERDRSVAVIEAVVLFGIELVDGMPEDDGWLKKLQFMSRRGKLNLGEYDLEDELDREFLYKRYIILGKDDLALVVSSASGVSPEEIEKARETFLHDQGREAH